MWTMLGNQFVHPARRALLPLILLAGSGGCAKRYGVEGLVLETNPAGGTMIVSHREIKGYMPAMAMPFRVERPGELEGLTPGSRVEFELRVSKSGAVARKVRKPAATITGDAEADEPIRLPEPPQKLKIGDLVPDFELTDQQQRTVRLSAFRGRVVVIDFIYTRCPLPEVCPRLSAGFAVLQRQFPDAPLTLLSITLDPAYDTPAVLADYARRYAADPARWRFLTGPSPAIQLISGYFGLVYWPEEGLITHTTSVAVIGRDGRLKAVVEGLGFTAQQLGHVVRLQLERGSADQ